MAFFRWFVGLPAAAIVTAGLFFMMAGLIRQDGVDVPEATPYPELNIHAKITETPPGPPKPIRPTRADPPEIKIPPSGRLKEPGPVTFPKPKPGIDTRPGGNSAGFPKPVIKYPPQYPENCRSRAAEGTVTVQFDVTPEGDVVNLRIIESANSCFNRTVIKTVSKWKYPPATRGGRAVTRHGVVEIIRFELKD